MQPQPKKILCFGEILLRLSPFENGGWIARQQLPVFIGGAEANVATALSGWGMPAAYCTAMPQHYLGDDIDAYLRGRGIDTTPVLRSGNRVGIYYLQQGADLKHAGVIYDRAHSSFYDLKPGDIDWDAVLADVSWFHFSAITPALNERMPAVCREALEAATARGITVSVDLNYRAKLWQYGKQPAAVMPELVTYCDVVMGNIWAAQSLLGIPVDESSIVSQNKSDYLAHAARTAAAIQDQYPRCRTVAQTFRFGREGGGIDYYAALDTGGRQYVSPHFMAERVPDKIGSGDCFMGGLIYGLYQGQEPQQIIDFAAAAAFGKLHEKGDATSQTVAQVQSIIQQYDQQTTGA